jgi:type I restriction enzyme S subunit
MSEWKTYKLRDVVNILDYKRIPLSSRQREQRRGKYPYYGAQGIIDYIDDYIFDGTYLLVAEDGENLRSKKQHIAQLVSGKYWVNNHAHILESNGLCDIRYICYLLNVFDISGYITGSAQPKLNQANLLAIEISLPPLAEQKRIADILSAIDDKIELNRRINANLEQQAQALYKSWFVDNKKDDWEKKRLDDIISIYDSQRKPLSGQQREKMEKIYPYYGAASLMDYVDNYLFDGIYLLLGEDGTVSDSEGFPMLQYVWGKFWVNNHAHILQGKNGFTTESLYILLKQTNVSSIVTGAVQPKISQANLKSVPITMPPINLLNQYNNIIKPIFNQIRINHNQIQQLSTLRDTLLPKLMSGEIKA